MLAAAITAATLQDRDGARLLLANLPGGCKRLGKIWVDGGYAGQLVDWVAERFAFCLAAVLRPKERKGFVLLPRRWVVERTFGWLNRSRRLSKGRVRGSGVKTGRGGRPPPVPAWLSLRDSTLTGETATAEDKSMASTGDQVPERGGDFLRSFWSG